jgi:hypothetical protein
MERDIIVNSLENLDTKVLGVIYDLLNNDRFGSISFKVKKLSGVYYDIILYEFDTVADIKEQLKRYTSSEDDGKFILMYRGVRLNEVMPLFFYDIKENSVISMIYTPY